jgi:yeast amino acid transporter
MMGEIVVITNLFKFRVDPSYLVEVGYPQQNLQWWPAGEDPSSAIWIGLSLAIIFLLNLLPAKQYGEVEYVIGCIKISFLVAIIMINIVLNAENRFHDSRFWAYQLPWGFSSTNMTVRLDTGTGPPVVYTGSLGIFTALWTGLATAFFTMAGWDITFITAPENENLMKAETVKLSGRKIGLRIVVLYVLSIFSVSLNVPYNDYPLGDLANYDLGQGQNSIFVLAAIREHVPVLPHVLNAFFIFSALAIASNSLFSSSRILYALAGIHDAWPWFLEDLRERLERTRWGIPHRAVFTSWLFGFLSFLSLGTTTSTVSEPFVSSIEHMLNENRKDPGTHHHGLVNCALDCVRAQLFGISEFLQGVSKFYRIIHLSFFVDKNTYSALR